MPLIEPINVSSWGKYSRVKVSQGLWLMRDNLGWRCWWRALISGKNWIKYFQDILFFQDSSFGKSNPYSSETSLLSLSLLWVRSLDWLRMLKLLIELVTKGHLPKVAATGKTIPECQSYRHLLQTNFGSWGMIYGTLGSWKHWSPFSFVIMNGRK